MSSIMLLPVLETERLTIRPLVMSDLDACLELYVEISWGDSTVREHADLFQFLDQDIECVATGRRLLAGQGIVIYSAAMSEFSCERRGVSDA